MLTLLLVMLQTLHKERVPALFLQYQSHDHGLRPRRRGKIILYSHGNAEDIFNNYNRVRQLSAKLRCDLFVYDYVGYSISNIDGDCPSPKGCLRAADAAFCYVTQHLKRPTRDIFLYGRSIGSGPTLHLASQPQCRASIAGVVLECGITSVISVLLGNAAVMLNWLDFFKNSELIQQVTRPITVLHGRRDRVVPFSHGQTLFERAFHPYPMFVADHAGHNNMPYHDCDEHVNKFIEYVTSLQSEGIASEHQTPKKIKESLT